MREKRLTNRSIAITDPECSEHFLRPLNRLVSLNFLLGQRTSNSMPYYRARDSAHPRGKRNENKHLAKEVSYKRVICAFGEVGHI